MYLGCVSTLSSFRSSLDFLRFFKVAQKSGQSPCTKQGCKSRGSHFEVG